MKYTPVSVLRFASFNAHWDNNNVWFWWPLNGGEEDPKKRRSPPSLGFYAALNGLLTIFFGKGISFQFVQLQRRRKRMGGDGWVCFLANCLIAHNCAREGALCQLSSSWFIFVANFWQNSEQQALNVWRRRFIFCCCA